MMRTGAATRIVQDSPAVRDLLVVEAVRDEQADRLLKERMRVRGKNPETNSPEEEVRFMLELTKTIGPGRRELLQAMALEPAVAIPQKSYARRIETSEARCVPMQLATATFIKIRITSGPYRGREGWVCDADIIHIPMSP